MSAFWSLWIVLLVVANIVFAFWLMISSSKKVPRLNNPEDVSTTGHVWDGDLAEYNNPLPRWWLYTIYATIIWGVLIPRGWLWTVNGVEVGLTILLVLVGLVFGGSGRYSLDRRIGREF